LDVGKITLYRMVFLAPTRLSFYSQTHNKRHALIVGSGKRTQLNSISLYYSNSQTAVTVTI